MTEDDNIRIEQLFREASLQEIADDGFTDRVMACLPAEDCVAETVRRPVTSSEAADVRRRRLMTHLWTAACVAAGIVMVVAGRGWEEPATYLYVLIRTLPTFDTTAICHLPLLSASITAAALWVFHRLDDMPVELRKRKGA